MSSGGGAYVSVIRGALRPIKPPLPLLIIAQQWPSWLVVALAHDLPIAGAYFPAKLHRHFKPKSGLTWYDSDIKVIANHLSLRPPRVERSECIGLISGTEGFIKTIRPCLPNIDRCIVIHDLPLQLITNQHSLRRRLQKATTFLCDLGLSTIQTANADFGGCTSAVHACGFGEDICSSADLPCALPNVQRTLSHYLSVAAEGNYPTRPPPPILSEDQISRQKVLFLSNTVRREGLFPCHDPTVRVLCPSVFARLPNNFVVRQLMVKEMLRVYSIPAQYDESLLSVYPTVNDNLPFLPTISPDILTSLIQQLWGQPVDGGGKGSEGRDTVSIEDTPQLATESIEVNAVGTDLTSHPNIGAISDHNEVWEENGLMDDVQLGTTNRVDTPNNIEVTKEMVDNVQMEAQPLLVEAKAQQRAAKADDAEVPVHLWNDVIKEGATVRSDRCDACVDHAVDVLRDWGLKRFWKRLYDDCIQRLRTNYGREWFNLPRRKDGNLTNLGIEIKALSDIMWYATECNWFEYKSGSALHYFRFPLFYQGIARDGVQVFFEKDGPELMRGQPPVTDEQEKTVLRSKVGKVIKRGYLFGSGIRLRSLIRYFAVPKTDMDYRIVYDATANGLNDAVWAPSFWLPTVDTLVRNVDANTWMLDRDIGDMFLNFPLDRRVWPYTGLNLETLFDGTAEEDADIIKMAGSKWVHWGRCLMGFKPSPYNAIKTALVVEEVAKGDRHCESNPFQWDRVRLNLPGNADYDPSLSWVTKIRKDGLIACDIFTFVDDERLTGPTRELVWQAGHRLAYIQAYLGLQDAARKLRPMNQQGGAWAGAVVHTIPEVGVCVLTSEEKWKRFKDIIIKWHERLEKGEKELDHKELLSDRGFCVHLCNSYPAMKPYLKGFHLTIEMWRGNRDAEGWKLPSRNLEKDEDSDDGDTFDTLDEEVCDMDDALLSLKLDEDSKDDATATTAVESNATDEIDADALDSDPDEILRAPTSGLTTPVPRFIDDLKALLRLSESDSPPVRVVRSKTVVTAVYGFGDASGKGFCGTLGYHNQVNYRIGVWGRDEQSESSNYKELCNLVQTCEEEAAAGRLYNAEFFLFTDNSTAESCFYRGSSKSKLLHELVIRLRQLEMDYNLIIHVIHVAGERMIAQGTDGGSRGSLLEGVLSGRPMLEFVELGSSAVDRHPPLLDWIRGWASNPLLSPLTPEEWFVEAHGICGGELNADGIWMPRHEKPRQMHLWCPAPAVADAALEELLKARHKRTDTFHIVAIPRLMTPRWRRLYWKACDFVCEIPAGSAHWPTNMFEPLWLGIVLPFTHHRPWQLGRAPLLLEMEREMRQVLKGGQADGGDILRKLLQLNSRLSQVPENVARGMLRMPRDQVRVRVSNKGDEG